MAFLDFLPLIGSVFGALGGSGAGRQASKADEAAAAQTDFLTGVEKEQYEGLYKPTILPAYKSVIQKMLDRQAPPFWAGSALQAAQDESPVFRLNY